MLSIIPPGRMKDIYTYPAMVSSSSRRLPLMKSAKYIEIGKEIDSRYFKPYYRNELIKRILELYEQERMKNLSVIAAMCWQHACDDREHRNTIRRGISESAEPNSGDEKRQK